MNGSLLFTLRAFQMPMCMIVCALLDPEVCQSGSEGLDWGRENGFEGLCLGVLVPVEAWG